MDSWSGAQRQNLSVVIYHTLFSNNEEQFHQTGFKREKKREKRELELENFTDCQTQVMSLLNVILSCLTSDSFKDSEHRYSKKSGKCSAYNK